MNLLQIAKERVDTALADVIDKLQDLEATDGPTDGHRLPTRLADAMRYAVLSPGKRLRPALVIGGARAVGLSMEAVLPAACAVEMVHAYSLVHDDLPILDDDDLRRGQPTLHRAFDEATALLTGDALLTEALALLTSPPTRRTKAPSRPRDRLAAVRELARAIGAAGMVGGQYDDVFAPDAPTAPADREHAALELISVHRRKTGRLIQASVCLGAIYGGAKQREITRLRAFGADLGLAFQLVDDALDGDGVAKLRGADTARAEALARTEAAIAELKPLGRRAKPLVELARAIVDRGV